VHIHEQGMQGPGERGSSFFALRHSFGWFEPDCSIELGARFAERLASGAVRQLRA